MSLDLIILHFTYNKIAEKHFQIYILYEISKISFQHLCDLNYIPLELLSGTFIEYPILFKFLPH